ncbi:MULTISPECIES: hypothetical protein [Sorangium]|uniref:Coenzyme Q (Ubiquinone) biosynthesis protein Coq4 n=1 Tax=Sorangium cellulosum TaxID=56 RepID=A0A4P2R612_SORCE|nr:MULTISPECIES: hypothetical protein [Sorangium]AUX38587.1 hypothetical protein SOCE836_108340 [Sorangium cellulosum]WCQ97871.1 hypothetical protein NQZ70_10669 [Sorangium sp. Soce836]
MYTAIIDSIANPSPTRETPLERAIITKTWRVLGLQGFIFAAYLDYFCDLFGIPKGRTHWRIYDYFRERCEDPEVAGRFRGLEHLPEGTFGRELWKHCRAKGVPLPGEPRGLPLNGAVHDMIHLLSGYDITSWEEMLATAFSLGFMFTRKARNYAPRRHLTVLPVRILASLVPIRRVQRAIRRGEAMTVDLFGDWDPWEVMEMPLEEIKRNYNITPE